MKKLLLPLILLLVGTGGGVGAALFLGGPEEEPMPDLAAAPCGPDETAVAEGEAKEVEPAPVVATSTEFAKIANQFVIPVVSDSQIEAMIVLSLSIEVPEGQKDTVFALEPKLRDQFMQVLFNHANIGGFSGNFTSNENMRILRGDLQQSARALLGDTAQNVLILELVRQDA